MIFTHLLYAKDEIIASFVISFIKNEDINKSIFFLHELYSSGFYEDSIELIFQVYYDNYYINYPYFEDFIISKISNFKKNNNFNLLVDIIKELWTFTPSLNVFILNYYINHCKLHASINKNSHFNNFGDAFLHSFYNNNIQNICFYINYYCSINKYNEILELFNIDDNYLYTNKQHLILSYIISKIQISILNNSTLDNSENSENSENVLLCIDNNPSISVKKLEFIDPIKHRAWKYLRNTRLYSIEHDWIGVYNLSRFNNTTKIQYSWNDNNVDDNMFNMYAYNWEYYSSFSPIWKKRIDEYKGIIDHDKKELIIDDNNQLHDNSDGDTLFEKFYNNYNYEPDEQPLDTTMKSIITINNKNILDLYHKFSNSNNSINLINCFVEKHL